MNKRQAKIYALEVASGVLRGSCDTLEIEEEYTDDDHTKIVVELNKIANSLWKRCKQLKENTRRG